MNQHKKVSGLLIRWLTIFFLLIPVISPFETGAQVLKGRITDKSGEAVRYVTVFIQELKQGTASNAKGNYEIRLPSGDYTIVYQSLGYIPVTFRISLAADTIIRDVTLAEEYYQIPEVRITESGEDPAYYIMRKAIGLAPFYLNHISHYKAEVYLKGNAYIRKIPPIVRRSLKLEARSDAPGSQTRSIKVKEGDSFLMESFNEIEFTAPDKYVQRIISFNTSFPDQGDEISPMDYIKASFYQPIIAEIGISPLSPTAFSYYKFRYLGASLQGKNTINKIEVIPRHKSQQLFSGTIYVIEDLWCLHSVDLTNENLAGTIHIRELHVPVQDDIWMPVSHYFEMNFRMMGFKADVNYQSSVQYLNVEPNPELKSTDPVAGSFTGNYKLPDTLMTKSRKKIEEILQKEEMSNRDMIKLADLMNKESAASMSDSAGKNLEIKDKTQYIFEKNATRRDSAYWAEIRPIPLSEQEIRTLSEKTTSGSIREMKQDSSGSIVQKRKSPFVKNAKDILFGHTWSDSTGSRFTSGGLVNFKSIGFNTVDGLIVGTDFRFSKDLIKNRTLSFYPDIRYGFGREKVMWRANINLTSGGMKPNRLFLQSGITSKDFNASGGIHPLVNTATSLLLKKNYLKLYESRYLTLGYGFELRNGVNVEISSGYEDRRVLENHTDFSIFRTSATYSGNIPDNEYLTTGSAPDQLIYDQKHFDLNAIVTFIPHQKYRVYNGNKVPAGSEWPEFRVIWKHSINSTAENEGSYSHFNMLKFEVSQRIDRGAFREIKWLVRTGGYLDNRGLSYYEYFHFNSQSFPLLIYNYADAHMLPRFYSLSTPEFFGEAHFKFTTPYLLLKYLPGLNNTLVRENLILSSLGSRYHSNYTEIGYSLSEIFLVGELGVYVGFNDLKYRSAGVRFSLRFK
jgi:hypothetical protein